MAKVIAHSADLSIYLSIYLAIHFLHRFAYQIGDISNVSVVLYEKVQPREDRKHMTPQVCSQTLDGT